MIISPGKDRLSKGVWDLTSQHKFWGELDAPSEAVGLSEGILEWRWEYTHPGVSHRVNRPSDFTPTKMAKIRYVNEDEQTRNFLFRAKLDRVGLTAGTSNLQHWLEAMGATSAGRRIRLSLFHIRMIEQPSSSAKHLRTARCLSVFIRGSSGLD